ncbi:unnamed protein product [Amoebophrya sp. A120]|nr:unnamed protein product [Amoebophrya sp. A120]|eukprot:GSA120T00017484001.1
MFLPCTVEVQLANKKTKAKGHEQGLGLELSGLKLYGLLCNRVYPFKDVGYLHFGESSFTVTLSKPPNTMIRCLQAEPLSMRQFAEKCHQQGLLIKGIKFPPPAQAQGATATTKSSTNRSASSSSSSSSTSTRTEMRQSNSTASSTTIVQLGGRTVAETGAPPAGTSTETEEPNGQHGGRAVASVFQQPATNIFDKLPDEIIDEVFSFLLNSGHKLQIRPVCKWFSCIMRDKVRRLTLDLRDARHIGPDRIIRMLHCHNNVREFFLKSYGHRLDIKALVGIGNTYQNFGKLQTVCFYKCPTLTSAQVATLLSLLPPGHELQRLSLLHCQQITNHAFCAKPVITENLKNLRTLEIGGHSDSSGGSNFDDDMYRMGVRFPSLRRLVVVNQRNFAAQPSGRFHEFCGTDLVHLDLRDCGVQTGLYESLKHVPKLRALNVAGCCRLAPRELLQLLEAGSFLEKSVEALDVSGLILPEKVFYVDPDRLNVASKKFPSLKKLRMADSTCFRAEDYVPEQDLQLQPMPSGLAFMMLPKIEHLDIDSLPVNTGPMDLFTNARGLHIPAARSASLRVVSGLNSDDIGDLNVLRNRLLELPTFHLDEKNTPKIQQNKKKDLLCQRGGRQIFENYNDTHQAPWNWCD